MPKSKLSQEEKTLLKNYDKGIGRYQGYARNTFQKDRRVNIRMVLEALQKKAVTEGIPYQTLMSSVLHKFVQRDVD